VILSAPSNISVGDLILNACRRMWSPHDCCFQDALSEQIASLNESWVWLKGAKSKEFFVYKDAEAAESWADGPTLANRNTMLHFTIFAIDNDGGEKTQVAVVFDRLDGEMKRFLEDLRTSLLNLLLVSERRGAA